MRLVNEGKYKYATREKNPTNDDNMIYYSEDYPYDYTITADGESIISLPGIPVGADIVRVDLETKTIPLIDWGWNPTSRVIQLTMNSDPAWTGSRMIYPTSVGQLLSIIYKIKKTTL